MIICLLPRNIFPVREIFFPNWEKIIGGIAVSDCSVVFGMFEHKNRHRLHTSSSLRKITNLLTRGVYSVPKNEQLFEMSLKGADYYIFS